MLFGLTLATGVSHAADQQNIQRIGLSLPMTGTASLLAGQFLQGARLAVEELKPGGAVELVVADDGCDTAIAELAAADLKNAGIAIATGYLCNEAAFAAVRGMRSTGIPILVAGARSERLLKDRGRENWNVWRMSPADRDAAALAAQRLSARWRGRPWAIDDDGTAYGRTFADEFRAMMEEAGQPPQFADNFRPAQSTQSGLVRRLRSSGVTAVFIAASAEDLAVIAGNMRQAEASFELAGGPTFDLLPWIEQAKDIPDGLLAVIEPQPVTLSQARELTEKLAEREIEPESYVYLGYAALQIAIAALRDNPAATSAALAETVFQTVLGNIDFDADGRNRVNPYELQIWQDGAFRPAPPEPAESAR